MPKLIATHEEAGSKLTSQIDEGKRIQELATSTRKQFENKQSEYYRWDSYNYRLLLTLFDDDEIPRRYYIRPYGRATSAFWSEQKRLNDDIRVLSIDIRSRIDALERIKNELPLYQLARKSILGQGLTLPAPFLKIVASFALATGAGVLSEYLIRRFDWHWLLTHPNSYGLRITAYLAVFSLFLYLFGFKKSIVGTFILALVGVALSILGGPKGQ